jgi:lipopolysaccharide export system permease protein
MILQRYLLKDIFSHTCAVGLVFLLVILASRSIQYLEQVSRGELSLELVFWVVLFRLPEFIELIIPFSFFLSMVLVIGRLCSDNEMIILEQNGFSNSRLLKLFFVASLFFALLTSVFSFWVTPSSKSNLDKIYKQTSFEEDFNSIQPGKFIFLKDGSVFYAEEKNNKIFSNIFINFSTSELKQGESFLTAKKSFISPEDPNLVFFENGESFSKDSENQVKMSFELLSMNVGKNFFLNGTSNQKDINEVQLSGLDNIWRISLPLLTLIAVFLALPLSKVKPRQGRYSKVLPCLMVFLVYLGLLLLVRGWLDEGRITFTPSLLLVHLSFFILGLILISKFSPLRTN